MSKNEPPSSAPSKDAQISTAEDLIHRGLYPEASEALRSILSKEPNHPLALLKLAGLSCLLGQFQDAETLLVRCVRSGNAPATAGRSLAFLLKQRGELEVALKLTLASLEALPAQQAIHQLLAEIHALLGNTDDARKHVQHAAELEPPETSEALLALDSGDLPGAIALFQKSLRQQPSSLRAIGPMASALHTIGQRDTACSLLRQAILIRPTHELHFLQLGDILSRSAHPADALICFQAALRLNPKSPSALLRVGSTLLSLENPAGAIQHLRAAIDLRPDWTTPLPFLAAALLQTGQQAEAVQTLQSCIAQDPRNSTAHSQLIQTLLYLHDSPETIFQAASEFAHKFELPVLKQSAPLHSTLQTRAPSPRVRIGYLSSDFRNHSIALFIEPVLRCHDRTRFEIYCYHTASGSDAVTSQIRGISDHWRECASLNDDQLARRIASDSIDVLVDLNNHTSGNRLPALIQRPATVQVTMLGLQQTTGLRSIDYRITDSLLDPPGSDDSLYSEQRIRLPRGAFVFAPPRESPEVSSAPHLAGDPFTFGCTNEALKITPQTLRTWAEILRHCPNARFAYFGRPGNVISKGLQELGIEPARILEFPRTQRSEFLKRHSEIDIALDPFPYNGLTATLLSCWMGVPCITLEGVTPHARAAAAILKRLDLPQLIAASPEEYISKAIQIGTNPQSIPSIRTSLRKRTEVAFTQAETHVRELEDAYLHMLAFSKTHPAV